MNQQFRERIQCQSCATGTGPHGCTDCLNTGIDPSLAGSLEQALLYAYAEGRKDEADEDMAFRLRVGRHLAEAQGEGWLSEQQCAHLMQIDLVSWRRLASCFSAGTSFIESDYPEPMPGEDSESVLRAALAQSPAGVMVNGLTEAETNATASVAGLVSPRGVKGGHHQPLSQQTPEGSKQ